MLNQCIKPSQNFLYRYNPFRYASSVFIVRFPLPDIAIDTVRIKLTTIVLEK